MYYARKEVLQIYNMLLYVIVIIAIYTEHIICGSCILRATLQLRTCVYEQIPGIKLLVRGEINGIN